MVGRGFAGEGRKPVFLFVLPVCGRDMDRPRVRLTRVPPQPSHARLIGNEFLTRRFCLAEAPAPIGTSLGK